MKRALIIAASVAAGLLVIGTIAWWMFLAMWVPTQGKARLETSLERSFRAEVSLGAVRYELIRGIVIEQVRVTDPESQKPLLVSPLMRIRVGWLRLLLHRDVAFRLHAEVEVPCHTEVEVSGRYHPQHHSITASAKTTDIDLATLGGALKAYLPPSLTDGTIRLSLEFTKPADQPATIGGHLTGRQLVWTDPSLRIRTDAAVKGRAIASRQLDEPWDIEALISLRDGTAEGPALKTLQTMTGIEGTARLTGRTLDIEELSGTILGSRWTVKGTVAPLSRPAIELLVSAHADLKPLMALVPDLQKQVLLSGPADLLAVVRGPLRPNPRLDTLLRVELHGVELAMPTLGTPVTEINGRLDYDVIGRTLSIADGRVHLLDQQTAIKGTMRFLDPMTVSLAVTGALPLEVFSEMLPADGALKELGGVAVVDVDLQGPLTSLSAIGEAALREARVRLTALPHPIEHLTGRLIFESGRIEARETSFEYQQQPMSLAGRVTFEPLPVITATLGLAHGQLETAAHITREELVIDDARLAFQDSRLSLKGSIGRQAPRRGRLTLAGTVQVADLTRIPFLPSQGLESWRLAGVATMTAEFEGPLDAWQDARVRGRLSAQQLGVREVPIEQLACEFEQQERTLRARVPSALIADGKFQGQITVKHQPADAEYLAEADLVGLQLARLAHVVPAWRERQVTGIASAHALMTGRWNERATWQGDGWLNASGERLADVPLLNKVLQGLFGVLGERLGLEPLRRAQITQASVTWRLSQERLYTEDLRLGGLAGTEPVAIYARGSAGLDQTLDFVIEPELSEGLVLESPTTSTLASTILKAAGQLERLRRLIGRHRLTGTLNKPEYKFEYGTGEVLKQIAPAPTDLLQGILDSLR